MWKVSTGSVLLLLFSRLVTSDSSRPHGLRHARPPRSSPPPGACSDSCPLSCWCHLSISSPAGPFPFCLQFFLWKVNINSVMSNSLWPHGLSPSSLLCPWNSPGKNTGVGCHFLLQGTFPTQGSNLGLLHCRQILCCLSHRGSPEDFPAGPGACSQCRRHWFHPWSGNWIPCCTKDSTSRATAKS